MKPTQVTKFLFKLNIRISAEGICLYKGMQYNFMLHKNKLMFAHHHPISGIKYSNTVGATTVAHAKMSNHLVRTKKV